VQNGELQMKKINLLAIEVLNEVVHNKTTMDNQTAIHLQNYIINLEKENAECQDKLHRRNMLIRNKDKRIKELEEFCHSEIMCNCGKRLWLSNFTNNPAV
jgi:hypothetical protein